MLKLHAASVTLFVGLLLIGFGCFSKPVPAPAPAPAPTTAPAPAPTPAPQPQAGQPGPSTGTRIAGNAIVATDQKPGTSVRITLLANDKPAFVVIRESDQRGPTLGTSRLLPAGENSDVLISISRVSKDGESLYATVHVDDGNGLFDRNDKPMLDGQGNELFAIIPIDVNAEEGGAVPTL